MPPTPLHPLRFKATPIIMLHPLHRKQLTLLGFAHPAAHATKANSARAAAVQSLPQRLHAARAADGLRQTVSLCRNSAPNAEHACNLKRADCIKKASLFLLMLLLPIGLFGCGAKKKYAAADVSVISFPVRQLYSPCIFHGIRTHTPLSFQGYPTLPSSCWYEQPNSRCSV